jgi:hypothetical protein
LGNRLPNNARRIHSRVHHLLQVLCGVAAVNGASGQIDYDIRPVDMLSPPADRFAIPAFGFVISMATKNNNLIITRFKMSLEHLSDLARATWDNDFHD